MPSLGPMELIIILVIVMLIFGVGKLADHRRRSGQGHPRYSESPPPMDDIFGVGT